MLITIKNYKKPASDLHFLRTQWCINKTFHKILRWCGDIMILSEMCLNHPQSLDKIVNNKLKLKFKNDKNSGILIHVSTLITVYFLICPDVYEST